MKSIILVLAFFSSSLSFSQTEALPFKFQNKGVVKTVSDFKTAYNEKNYNAIFSLFSTKMQRNFSVERITGLYGRIYKSKGAIKELKFEKTVNRKYFFKAKFKRDILDLVLDMDINNTIDGLIFKRPKRDYNR